MRYQLDLTIRHAEGALIRVLGLTERRGFRPLAVQGAVQDEQGAWKLQLTVEGERSEHTLSQQLGKLHDCVSVEVKECPV